MIIFVGYFERKSLNNNMKSLILPIILLCATLSIAQKPPAKFGDVSIDELKMTSYDKDSSAAAVVLMDYGEAYIDVNTEKMIFERHRRIKILKKEGLKWADASVRVLHIGSSKERVTGLKAVTYNLEGGKIVTTKMSNDGVFEERFNRYIDLQKFTLPNVKEGSVIEYTFRLTSDFVINFPNWQFQEKIPVVWSEYRALIPEFFIYQKYMQGYVGLHITDAKTLTKTNYNETQHRWVAKDVPAFKPEPYMTSEDDYVTKINFALSHINIPGRPTQEIMGSWEKLNNLYLESEYFGKAVDGSGFLGKVVEGLIAGKSSPQEKLIAVYNYIKESIEWNGETDKTTDNPNFKKVFEQKKGSSADINLALVCMLRKAGFEVDPVLISTRDHGFVREPYPMDRQFNDVICVVKLEGKKILLDATERLLPWNVLPERCLNGRGLVISKNNFGWIGLEATVRSKTAIESKLQMTETGELSGTVVTTKTGYDAHRMRKTFSNGETEYIKEILNGKSWEIRKSEFKSVKELHEPVIENLEVEINEQATAAGDVIYINPFITSRMDESPFKLAEREYPVDFGSPFDKIYIFSLKLPEGYVVDELPQSKMLMLPGNAARFAYNTTYADGTITLTTMLNVNKAIFIQTEYPNLREFYSQVVAKQAEQIVLKKK